MKPTIFSLLLLTACGGSPSVCPPPKVPSIPTTAHETWRCTSPSGVVVFVVGVPEPKAVDVQADGAPRAPTECHLVPLVD